MAKLSLSPVEAAAAIELNERKRMAIRIFRPQPGPQSDFFKMPRPRFTLLQGGNRCVSVDTILIRCNKDGSFDEVRAGDIEIGETITGVEWYEDRWFGSETEVLSTGTFTEEAIEIKTEGSFLKCTKDHQLLCTRDGESVWIEAKDLVAGDVIATYRGDSVQPEAVAEIKTSGSCEFAAIGTSLETYVSNGIVSHNSGKTTCAAVMFAAIATDTPITMSDGTEVDLRMPWQKGRRLLMWVVGDGEDHLGKTIWRVCCQPGLFNVVVDPVTKELRAKRPTGDENLKARLSPPLIPARYIKKVAWKTAATNVFDTIIVHSPSTGEELAMICGYSSKGAPKAGDPVDLIWVDERIANNDGYIAEMKGRLVDAGNGLSQEGSGGQMYWSSWASEDSEELREYNDMIEKLVEQGRHDVARKNVLTMSGNRHLDKRAIEEVLAGFSAEERQARDLGLYISTNLRMFPLFDKYYHIAYGQDQEQDDLLAKLLRRTDGIPPNDWTKYLIVDPGTNAPAALLCSVPPPELGDYVVPYQEFYPGRADAVQLAALIKREMPNEKYYQFIIDHRASRQTPMGFGSTIKAEYERAFKLAGLTCHISRNQFTPGCDDVGGRQMVINGWTHPTKTGLPKLRIVPHRCPKLTEQLTKIKKKVVQKEVKDERKQDGQPSDVVDALAYFAGAHPRYVYIKPSLEDASPAYQRYMKRFGQQKDQNAGLSIGTFY